MSSASIRWERKLGAAVATSSSGDGGGLVSFLRFLLVERRGGGIGAERAVGAAFTSGRRVLSVSTCGAVPAGSTVPS